MSDANKPTDQHIEQGLSEITTNEKASTYAQSDAGVAFRAENKKAEAKLVRKLDMIILPLATLLYLSAYLDRGNMGNAKLQGLMKTVLHNDDTLYSLALCCFFITYILFSIPGTLLAKQVDPSRSIAAGALLWSIAATAQAGVKNPAGLMVTRLFIGLGEALFGQAMVLYFSYFYTKQELAKRVGLFISAGSLAGAFGGLIAYGVSSIKNSSIVQWRILFLIEGIPAFVLAIVVFFCLPGRPETTRYLNEDERLIATTRLNAEGLGGHGQAYGINWAGVRRALTDWKVWVTCIMYSAMNMGLGSVGGFLPTIVKGLGYSAAKAQLMTVPPYAVSLVFMLLLTSFSDRFRTRGLPAAAVFAIGLTGWGILYGVNAVKSTHTELHVRYFGCICVVVAGYSAIPIIQAWISNNAPDESQRAVGLGGLNSIGQCLSILAAFSFPSAQGPRYHKGIAINMGFQALGLVIALGMTTYFRLENRRRDRKEGGRPTPHFPVDTSVNYDRSVGYRYVA